MAQRTVQQTFAAAVDTLVDLLKHDRSILAAVLCGSLSHDTVWAKSDVDLVLVTIDDRKVEAGFLALYADGVNVHAMLLSRTEFRKIVEGSIRNSFMHSFLTKGRLLYTHDPTIADLCATLNALGDRDMHVQLLRAGTGALGPIYKAHKWFLTRGDLNYTALWILYAATSLAEIEVISARMLVDREVIPNALKLNPPFFATVYTDLLNTKKTRERVKAALDAVDGYLADRAPTLFREVIDYLRDAGEARSATDIDTYFKRQINIDCASIACEYLSDQGLIGKASLPVRVTRKSTVDVQELAFFHLGSPHVR